MFPWKVSKHEIEPSRRLNVGAHAVTQGSANIYQVHTISVFRSGTLRDIRRPVDKVGEKCDF